MAGPNSQRDERQVNRGSFDVEDQSDGSPF